MRKHLTLIVLLCILFTFLLIPSAWAEPGDEEDPGVCGGVKPDAYGCVWVLDSKHGTAGVKVCVLGNCTAYPLWLEP